jgi:hypothetical protein
MLQDLRAVQLDLVGQARPILGGMQQPQRRLGCCIRMDKKSVGGTSVPFGSAPFTDLGPELGQQEVAGRSGGESEPSVVELGDEGGLPGQMCESLVGPGGAVDLPEQACIERLEQGGPPSEYLDSRIKPRIDGSPCLAELLTTVAQRARLPGQAISQIDSHTARQLRTLAHQRLESIPRQPPDGQGRARDDIGQTRLTVRSSTSPKHVGGPTTLTSWPPDGVRTVISAVPERTR